MRPPRLQDWWFTSLQGVPDSLQPPLEGHVDADVAVVGAGAAGLAAAMRLHAAGRKVVLIDRNMCGGSSTGKSAGFLTPDSELELSQLLRRFGVDGARELWAVPSHGIDLMTQAVRDNGIACDLIPQDSLFLSSSRSGISEVREEAAARQKLGLPLRIYEEGELPQVIGSSRYRNGVRYPGCYGINGLRYAQGIKHVLLGKGVRIFESTEVRSVEDHTLRTHMGTVTANEILFCIDKPHPELTPYFRNVYHAQTFLSVTEPLSDAEVKSLFPEAPLQCWDSSLIYTYFRLTGSRRLLVGGGSLYTTYSRYDTTRPRVIEHVLRDLRHQLPILERVETIQYWPGRIDMTRDLLPTLVRDPKTPWIHFVLGCVGLPWATACGDFVASRVVAGDMDHPDIARMYSYFHPDRRFLLPLSLERLLGKKLVFTINNSYAKYRQVDVAKSPN